MKKIPTLFIFVLVVLLFVSCLDMPFDSLIVDNDQLTTEGESISKGYIDIPDGWQINKNGDYAKLEWNPDFKIENGSIISFIDSQGEEVTLEKDSYDFVISDDNPSVVFNDDTIILTIKGYTLEFLKKK